jgi:hypothetical protein
MNMPERHFAKTWGQAFARVLGCLSMLLMTGAHATNFFVSSSIPPAPAYAPKGIKIVVGGVERLCELSETPKACVIALPESSLLTDVVVDLASAPESVFDKQDLTFEPLRFSLIPEDTDRIDIRATPADSKGSTLDLRRLYANRLIVSPRPDLGDLQDFYQQARAVWVVQERRTKRRGSPDDFAIRAAFIATQAGARLSNEVPPFRGDADIALESARRLIDGLSDREINKALGGGDKRNMAAEARKASKDILFARAKPLQRAWKWILEQPETEQLNWLGRFEEEFSRSIPSGSSGGDLVDRVRVTRSHIYRAQSRSIAKVFRCGLMDRATFDKQVAVLINRLEGRVRANSAQNTATISELCVQASANTTQDDQGRRDMLLGLCADTRTLKAIRASKDVYPPEDCPGAN